MNLILWMTTGVLAAWLASFRDGTVCLPRLLVTMGFAALGALLGRMLAVDSPQWLSADTHWPGIAAAVSGAAFFLLIANLRAMRASGPEGA